MVSHGLMNIPQAQLKAGGISRVAVKACSAQRLRDVPQHGGEGVRRGSQGGGQHEGHLETAQRHDIDRHRQVMAGWRLEDAGGCWRMRTHCYIEIRKIIVHELNLTLNMKTG